MCAAAPAAGTLLAVRVLLVVNPSATRVTPRRRELVEHILGAEHDLTVVETAARDHATDLARTAVEERIEHVVVLAGDGTLNEVVAALAGTDCVLSCLPGGSTNIFSRTIGLPDDLEAAARRVSAAIREGRSRRVGLGSVNGRHFLLHAGIGWDAELVSIVERHAGLKPRIGHALFVYAGLRAFFGTYDRRRPHFSVQVGPEGTGTQDAAYFALVMNSDPYTYVHTRPFVVSPHTSVETPLAVIVCRSMKVRHFLPAMVGALRGGGIGASRWVDVHADVEELTISRLDRTPPPSMPHQVDGDHLGQAEILRFVHHPNSLKVLVP